MDIAEDDNVVQQNRKNGHNDPNAENIRAMSGLLHPPLSLWQPSG
jgi:hypothetical protein